jgi:UDP-glucose 4-epimerase
MPDLALVTGGAGFIGSHLVDRLVEFGRRVRVFDDFSTGQRENLAHHGNRIEIVEGCLTDSVAVTKAMAGANVAYHLGAMASVAKSLEDPLGCHAICGTGTLHVLEAARAAGTKRVVYAASSSAYGSASDPAGQGEETPLEPLSPYAAAKLTGEMYLQAYAASLGVETVRLRFFNIFGPRQRADSPYSGVIAIFVASLTEGRPISVHGDGLQVRDFTYVANAVQALVKAGERPGVSGKVFNVGTGRGVTILDLVNALAKLLGQPASPQHGSPRLSDVRFSKAKIDRIIRGLGYEPSVSFEEGLKLTLDWYSTESRRG